MTALDPKGILAVSRGRATQIAKDYAVLISGPGSGQLIALASTPIITRLVQPTDMGVFGTYTTIVALLTIVASLGYETAIIGARGKDTFLLVALTSAATIVLATLVAATIFVLLISGVIYGLPLWLPVIIALDTIFANFFTACQYWYVRAKQYKRVSLGLFTSYAGRSVCAAALATSLTGRAALVLGNLIGRGVALIVIDRGGILFRSAASLATPSAIWEVARRYRKAPLFIMPSSLLESLLAWLPLLLTTAIFGLEVGGQMTLVLRVQGAALSLLGRTTADIYQSQISGHGIVETNKVLVVTSQLILMIVVASIPFLLLLLFFAEAIFHVVFGATWAIGGKLFAILAPMAVLQICGAITTRLLLELNRQEIKLYGVLALLVVLVSSFATGYLLSWTVWMTLTVLSASYCIVTILWILKSLAICKGIASANPVSN